MKFSHVLCTTRYEHIAYMLKSYFKTKLLCSFGDCANRFVNKSSQLNRNDVKAGVNKCTESLFINCTF